MHENFTRKPSHNYSFKATDILRVKQGFTCGGACFRGRYLLKTVAWKQKQSVYFCTTNGFLSLQPEWKVSPLPLCMFVSENSRVDLERRMRTGGWWLQGVKMDISVPTIFSCSLSDLLSFPSCHHYWRAGTSSPLLTSLPLPSVWMGVTSAQLWQGGSARLLLESKSWISHLVRSAFKLLHFSEDVAAGWFLTPS